MLGVMYAFYPSTVLIALLRLSAVSAIPTPDKLVIPQVQTCTTSWNRGESNPQELTGYCEYEGINCDKGLSVMVTAEFGETACTPQNGKPTLCCLHQVKCGDQRQGHCQNREKTCFGGSYSIAAGNLDISCPGSGYCCEPPHLIDFLDDGRGSGRIDVINPFGITGQPSAGFIAGSKDLESNAPLYLDRPSYGVDLEAFKTNFITEEVPYGTDSTTSFAEPWEHISQGTPRGDWDR